MERHRELKEEKIGYGKYKKIDVKTKTCWHCIIGIIEFIGIPLLIAYLTTYLAPLNEQKFLWQYIERTAFCFVFYEVIVIGIRKMQIDVRRDALSALRTAHNRALLSIEEENQNIKNDLLNKIDKVLDTGVLNQLDVIASYEILKKYLSTGKSTEIKLEIIKIEHCIETDNLLWNYTLLLRLFK